MTGKRLSVYQGVATMIWTLVALTIWGVLASAFGWPVPGFVLVLLVTVAVFLAAYTMLFEYWVRTREREDR